MTTTTDPHLIDDLCQLILGSVDPSDIDERAWPAIIGLARRHGLGPMLHGALRQAGMDMESEPLMAPLVQSVRQTAVHFLLIASTQAKVDAALRAAGIPVIWFKGIDLARTVYPQPSLRPMGDIDCLVPFEQREAALAVAQQLGYQADTPELFRGVHDLVHHYHLRGNIADAVHLELHYRLLAGVERFLSRDGLAWFWSQARPWTDGRLRFQVLSREAHLLFLCAHALLQHGEADFRLLRYFDLHRLITGSPGLDWQVVVDQAAAFGWTYAVERALAISHGYFATPLPHGLLAELQVRRPVDEDLSLVQRKQKPGNRWERTVLSLSTRGWRSGTRWAVGLLFPTPAYMRWRYGVEHGWQILLYYPYRWLDVAGEALKTVGRRMER